MPETSALSSRRNPSKSARPATFNDRLPEAAAWLSRTGDEQALLAQARLGGWQTEQWDATFFGQLRGTGPARLLVYLPPGRAARINLAALLAAAHSYSDGELPLTLKFLSGPLTDELLAVHAAELAADAIIYAEGEYQDGRPMLSLGLKGRLEVELRVKTLAKDAPSVYSEIMPGAAWPLVQAVNALKSESQEVQIEDFEEDLFVLPADEAAALRRAVPGFTPGLAARLKEYGLTHYIFGMGDRLVLQTQFLVPSLNVSALECGSFMASGRLKLPATARARLDFWLVPYQQPTRIFARLCDFLMEKDFGPYLEITKLPGSLRPSRTPLSASFVQAVLAAGDALDQPPLVVPVALFAGPLADLKEALGNPPAVCFGLGSGRPSRKDFTSQARWLAHLFGLVPGGDAAMFEIYPDQPLSAPPRTATSAPANAPDLSDLAELIPDFPELDL